MHREEIYDFGGGRSHAGWWRLPLLLASLLFVMIFMRTFVSRPPVTVQPASDEPTTASAVVVGDSVALTVDFGNGAKLAIDALPYQPDMTVRDLMDRASEFRPRVTYHGVGDGQSAFLTGIAGIGNDDAAGRYWQYWVNDERADEGFGTCRLESGDRVLWRLAPEE